MNLEIESKTLSASDSFAAAGRKNFMISNDQAVRRGCAASETSAELER